MRLRFLGFILLLLPVSLPAPTYAMPKSSVVFKQIQTSPADDSTASIVLYNNTQNAISLDGWVVEYMHVAAPGAGEIPVSICNSSSWSTIENIEGATFEIELTGTIPANEAVQITDVKLVVQKSGSLRLLAPTVKDAFVVQDLVGWGSSELPAPCFEVDQAQIPHAGESIMRKRTGLKYSDTDHNHNDFITIENSLINNNCTKEPCEAPHSSDETMYQLIITELLPDPTSPQSDAKDEFIELFNPNNFAINLKDYILQSGPDYQYEYIFADVEILPGEYMALYAGETALVLGNKGSKVRLVAPDSSLVDEVEYTETKPGLSWALSGEEWFITDPSAGAENVIILEVAERVTITENVKECGEGKFRNPSTGRCKAIAASALAFCDPGEERNPETNRCRKVAPAALASTVAECKPGSVRNPETNRCRKLAQATTTATPCRDDQERNPETNRCRKIAGSNVSAPAAIDPRVVEQSVTNLPDSVNWAIAVAAVIGVMSYGIFEWRHEISQLGQRARGLRIYRFRS